VKPLGYREVFWQIAPGTREGRFTISAFDEESHSFDPPADGAATTSRPIDLEGLLARMGSRSAQWTRSRVPDGLASRIGAELWTALPAELADAVRWAGGQTRLKIASAIPGVADLPWEWLRESADAPVALRPDVLFARSVPLRFPVLPLSVEMPLRVLLLVPNPKDERLLNAEAEIAAVSAALPAPSYAVRVLDFPRLEQLAEMLAADQPNIVHYVGHGGLTAGEGSLILQDPDRRSRWVSASELAALLPSSVRLLCLSTPFTTENYQVLGLTHLARAAGVTGLPTAVVNQYPLDGNVAQGFWSAFYGSLVEQGGNVNEAVQAARLSSAGASPGFADWGSFSLVVRDQTGVAFDLRSAAEATERRPAELRAQFAAEAANELAQQVQQLPPEVSSGLKTQYEVEQRRVTGLLEDLTER
jgi:hypothetical protein